MSKAVTAQNVLNGCEPVEFTVVSERADLGFSPGATAKNGKKEFEVLGFGPYSAMSAIYPYAQPVFTEEFRESIGKQKLGRAWVVRDELGHYWMFGSRDVKLYFAKPE